MQHKKSLSLFFLGIVIISIFTLIPIVSATNYEWIRNSGFEVENLVRPFDGGFESGGFIYGNWTGGGTYLGIADNVLAYDGIYIADFGGGTTGGDMQITFANFPINNVISLGFWGYNNAGNHNINFEIQTNNETLTYNFNSGQYGNTVWYYFNALSILNGHYGNITGFHFHVQTSSSGSSYWFLVDNVYIGQIGDEQTNITWLTEPWFNLDVEEMDMYSNITTLNGHTGLCSYYSYSMAGGAFPLMQKINYLDADLISEVSLWALTTVSNCRIRFYVAFSDGSTNYVTKTMTTTGIWEKLTFDYIIIPDHILEGIVIQILDGNSYQYTNIDDVSILASVPLGQSVFTWELNPEPISYDNASFNAYQRTEYVLTGFIHDENGTINGSGTFSLVSTKGTQTGIITNGVFYVTLSERITNSLAESYIELLRFKIVTDVNNFTVTVHANWVWIDALLPDEIPDEDVYLPNTNISMDVLIYLFILIIILVAPSLYIAFECAQRNFNPILGFMGTFTIMAIICVVITLINVWILVVAIIVDVFLGLYSLNSRGEI